MAFTDDLRGLSRAERIARVQAGALAARGELAESQASQALSLYAVTGTDELPEAACRCGLAGCRSGWPQIDEADASRGAANLDAQYAYFLGWRPDLPPRGPEQREAD